MPRYQIEMSLAVEDYVEDAESAEDGDAFTDCAEDTEQASDDFRKMARDLYNVQVEVISCTFVEFDSGNWTHANAYFEIEYEADQDIDALMQASS